MGVYMLGRQIPAPVLAAVLAAYWPYLLAGVAVAGVASALLLRRRGSRRRGPRDTAAHDANPSHAVL
ncbi:hypothetical protein WMF27_37465 [Sorangium sp. So ce281]|uniref:hypothetical protein n=1 Tax=Sorangium sp. So ce281 TaxID=3133293 RepID=UPI003F5DDF00